MEKLILMAKTETCFTCVISLPTCTCLYIKIRFPFQFQCLLGLDFLNTNKSGDMADLLKKFQEQHVPMKDAKVLHKTVIHGDQLTEERARNVQWTYKLGETEADRLEGLECTFSEFHLKMYMFEVKVF